MLPRKSEFEESKSDRQCGSIFFQIHDFFQMLFKSIENFQKSSCGRLGVKTPNPQTQTLETQIHTETPNT